MCVVGGRVGCVVGIRLLKFHLRVSLGDQRTRRNYISVSCVCVYKLCDLRMAAICARMADCQELPASGHADVCGHTHTVVPHFIVFTTSIIVAILNC